MLAPVEDQAGRMRDVGDFRVHQRSLMDLLNSWVESQNGIV